jgi:hypothetical protein
MGIGILQVSDIHLKQGDPMAIKKRIEMMTSALRPRLAEFTALLVLITGDVAFSGQKEEFEEASALISLLLERLRSDHGMHILGPVIVPGNHDCDLPADDDARPSLLNGLPGELGSLNLQGSKARQLLSVQDNFFAFEQRYSNVDRQGKARLYYSFTFDDSEQSIVVHCFNTSWVSTRMETQGRILVHPSLKPKVGHKTALAISIFHHPFPWFDPSNRRDFQRIVEGASDVILTGHEHDGDQYTRVSSQGAYVSYVEGAALDTRDHETGFNLIGIDFAQRTYSVTNFVWKKGLYEPARTSTNTFLRNPAITNYLFGNNKAFEASLERLEVSFAHPSKPEPTLDDLFVYPDLQINNPLEKKSRFVQSDRVLSFVVEQRFLNIAASAMAGKTTLAKKLYRDLRDRHKLLPLLVAGEDVSGKPQSAVGQVRDKAFRDQYEATNLEAFRQLPPSRKVLIVDNWQASGLNAAGKRAFLAAAAREFCIVVTLGAEQSWFEEVIGAAENVEASEFQHCVLREFGYQLRGQLVKKWHALGQDFALEEDEVAHRVSASENMLNSVIGKGLFPSYPFFVLYTLSASATQKQSAVMHGSYGHVYEAFLTSRLSNVSKKVTDIGTKISYLAMLAKELFDSGRVDLSAGEVARVHERFEKQYALRIPREEILKQLKTARILEESSGNIGFIHKYCYYYFVAKYFQKVLADNPTDQEAKAKLKEMADMVHDEDYMNILIFYIYLTEDRQLIEYFIERSKAVYAEYPPCDLNEDVDFVAALLQPRKLSLNTGNVNKNREEFLSQKDRAMEEESETEKNKTRVRYSTIVDESVKLDFAFHAIQVMGQVLRNFPGDLKADLKAQLTEECYQLGLRTIKSFITLIQTNANEIKSSIENLMMFHRGKSEDIAAREADHALAYLTEAGIFVMIKRVSAAVGLEDLNETYTTVRENFGESHVPSRLIYLAIQLDHFPKLPIADIEALKELIQGIVPHNILLLLVNDRLHLFPVDYRDRQRIAGLLDIQTKGSLLTEKKVKRKA